MGIEGFKFYNFDDKLLIIDKENNLPYNSYNLPCNNFQKLYQLCLYDQNTVTVAIFTSW